MDKKISKYEIANCINVLINAMPNTEFLSL